jgi:hypothetical protein
VGGVLVGWLVCGWGWGDSVGKGIREGKGERVEVEMGVG